METQSQIFTCKRQIERLFLKIVLFPQTASEEEGYSDDVDKYDAYRHYDDQETEEEETDDYDYDDYDVVADDDFVDRNNVDRRRSVTSPRRDFRAKLSSGGYPYNQVGFVQKYDVLLLQFNSTRHRFSLP